MLSFIRGLQFGGVIRRDLAADKLLVPLVSLHRPGCACWSWLLVWVMPRHERGQRVSMFRVVRFPRVHPQQNTRIDVDLFGIGRLHYQRQHY